jgi:hypothetical protein
MNYAFFFIIEAKYIVENGVESNFCHETWYGNIVEHVVTVAKFYQNILLIVE